MDGNKRIIINKNTKIYIMAPANTFTGGPELLHRLALDIYKIYKIKAKMFYLPNYETNLIHKNFKNYKINYSKFIEDNKKNILIVPEHFMFLDEALKYKNITKILWWLSIDNYFGYKFRYNFNKFSRSIIKIPFNLTNIFNKITNNFFGLLTYHDYLKFIYNFFDLKKFKELKQIHYHLAQSYYAYDFLKKYFTNLKLLSDYQRDEIINNIKKKGKNKKDLICYSNKSNDFINSIKKTNHHNMIQLSGFDSKQIINVYKKTKIYLDFGYHPGKDRMPREAVLYNNCIITNRRGSAKNLKDIPINKKYKFEEKKINLDKINFLISKIFKDHKKELKNFNKYKKIILNEKKSFYKDLKKIFIKK